MSSQLASHLGRSRLPPSAPCSAWLGSSIRSPGQFRLAVLTAAIPDSSSSADCTRHAAPVPTGIRQKGSKARRSTSHTARPARSVLGVQTQVADSSLADTQNYEWTDESPEGPYAPGDMFPLSHTSCNEEEQTSVTVTQGATQHKVKLGRFRALVLDVSYRPIDIVNWQRAVCLDIFDKADVLEYYPDIAITSATDLFQVPAVVRVRMYVKRDCIKLPPTRKNILLRDRHTCQYCGKTNDLSIDHVVPVSKGGQWQWNNLVAACTSCNQKKGAKTLAQMGWKPLQEPREPGMHDLGLQPLLPAKVDMRRTPREWRYYIEPFLHPKA